MLLNGASLDAPRPIAELLHPGLARRPDDVALISAASRWTWSELDARTNNLAANLLALGLRRGERVASLMPNRGGLLIHYIACIKAGLLAVPLNYRYMPPEIDHALAVSEASILFAHAEREQDLAASKLARRLPRGLISYGAHDGSAPRFEELIEPAASHQKIPVPEAGDAAFIFFTSGSTGPAKGVTHSCGSLSWMLASTAAAFGFTKDDVVLPGSSISHLGGFIFSFAALAAGARVVVARTFDSDEMLPLLREDRPTVLCMLPTALLHLVRDHGATCEDFKSVRICRSGSDKVPAELEREFTELTGLVIDEGYGMTEVGLATLNPPSGTIKMGSIGPPVPGFALSIRDESGREVPTGSEGRLWIKTRSATIGYWNNPTATTAVFRDGWLDSGDLMKADADGYLWFCGRKKQIIVHDGSNICPQEVEGALLEHPAVDNVGVVGVHDLVHGENVRAYVTLKQSVARPSAQELIRFARARVGYKAPEEIEFLSEMPLNPTGKVDRVVLKRMAQQRHATTAPA
jgi:acyl-CoA synthetase (AMP-forming)/AMP-acid ligase II